MTSRSLSNKINVSIIAGLLMYIIIGSLGLYLLRISWPAYDIAATDKSYSFFMLCCRLTIGIIGAIAAGITAGYISRGKRTAPRITGIIIFSVAAYIHICTRVWADYPLWYHLAYLLPIIPVTELSQKLLRQKK